MSASRSDQSPGLAWYRSPLVLVAAAVVVAAVVAVLVVALGGDDDTADVVTGGASDATAAIAPSEDIAPDPAGGITFGGDDIPESADVEVSGEPLPLYDGGDTDAAIGVEAPVVTAAVSLASGATLRLDPGEPRVIGFLAHWCPHCQAELPELAPWLASSPMAENAEFIAVSTSLRPDQGNFPPSRWFNRDELQAPVIVDDEAGTLLSTFGFGGFPSFVAIDADGVVVDRLSGNIGVAGFEQLFSHFSD